MSDIFDTGIPNIRVIIREATDNTLALEVPSLNVKIEKGTDYNVNIIPNHKITLRTGSYNSYADFALTSATASYALNASNQSAFPFSGSASITGSLEVNEVKLVAGDVSLTFTGSVTTGIFGATEYIYPFIPTSKYIGTNVEYVASRTGGVRIGMIMAVWSGSQSTVTDVSTTDVGDTSDIQFSLIQDAGYMKLRVESLGSGSYPWTVQSLFKLFPTL